SHFSLPPNSSGCVALAGRAALDALELIGHVYDPLNIDAGRDDVVAINFARLNEMLDLRDRQAAGCRHHRIEVARGLPVNEIAFRVAPPGVHEEDVGDEAGLHHVGFAVEIANFLALGDDRADARAGEEGGNPCAAGANALSHGALRVEFKLELA